MKNQAWVVAVFCISSGVAFAECSDKLDAETLMECITIEGSGANYNDWREEFAQQGMSASAVYISPVSGEDVRKISSAAGLEAY